MKPEYGDNEPIPQAGDNKLTGSEANIKTQNELEKELHVHERKDAAEHHMLAEKIRMAGKGSHDPYFGNSKKNM